MKKLVVLICFALLVLLAFSYATTSSPYFTYKKGIFTYYVKVSTDKSSNLKMEYCSPFSIFYSGQDKPVSSIKYELYAKASSPSASGVVTLDLSSMQFSYDIKSLNGDTIDKKVIPLSGTVQLTIGGGEKLIYSYTYNTNQLENFGKMGYSEFLLTFLTEGKNNGYIRYRVNNQDWKEEQLPIRSILLRLEYQEDVETAPSFTYIDVRKVADRTAQVQFGAEDSDDDTLSYTINWGDGKTTSGSFRWADMSVLVKHTYSSYKTYTIRILLSDPDNHRVMEERSITFSSGGSSGGGGSSSNSAPTIYWLSQTIQDKTIWPKIKVTDDKSSSISVKVTWGDGKSDSLTFSNGETKTLVHTYSVYGKYTITVKATDGNGAASKLTKTFEFKQPSAPKVYIKSVGEAS